MADGSNDTATDVGATSQFTCNERTFLAWQRTAPRPAGRSGRPGAARPGRRSPAHAGARCGAHLFGNHHQRNGSAVLAAERIAPCAGTCHCHPRTGLPRGEALRGGVVALALVVARRHRNEPSLDGSERSPGLRQADDMAWTGRLAHCWSTACC